MQLRDENKARELLVEYGLKLQSAGLVQGTWGNLSILLDDKYMICTPSGMDYNRLTPSDMVKVDIDSLEYEGDIKPTSEKVFHARIYKEHPDAGAIVHTHSTYSCVYASVGKDMPVKDKNTAAKLGKKIRCARYAIAGSNGLSENISKALGHRDKSKGCFMAHHGMVCYGDNMEDAFDNALLIEKTAYNTIEA